MNLVLAVVALLFGLSRDVDISDTPFAELTPRMVFDAGSSVAAYMVAAVLFLRSLRDDVMWPWRWRWNRYFLGNGMVKLFVLFCWEALVAYYSERHPSTSTIMSSAAAVLGLSAFYIEDLNVFEEKRARPDTKAP